MRYQGFSAPTGELDEMESSSVVTLDRSNPAFYCDCSDLPSLTRQEFAAECDINNLMSQFEKTGILPANLNNAEPRYLDVSNVPDLPEALNLLNEATRAFMSLPAVVRRDFDNDPVKFINFAEDEKNLAKMREWNLAPPAPVEPAPQKVQVMNPEPAKPPKDPPKVL